MTFQMHFHTQPQKWPFRVSCVFSLNHMPFITKCDEIRGQVLWLNGGLPLTPGYAQRQSTAWSGLATLNTYIQYGPKQQGSPWRIVKLCFPIQNEGLIIKTESYLLSLTHFNFLTVSPFRLVLSDYISQNIYLLDEGCAINPCRKLKQKKERLYRDTWLD